MAARKKKTTRKKRTTRKKATAKPAAKPATDPEDQVTTEAADSAAEATAEAPATDQGGSEETKVEETSPAVEMPVSEYECETDLGAAMERAVPGFFGDWDRKPAKYQNVALGVAARVGDASAILLEEEPEKAAAETLCAESSALLWGEPTLDSDERADIMRGVRWALNNVHQEIVTKCFRAATKRP